MAKRGKAEDLRRQIDELLADVGDDRERLVGFIDRLITAYDEDRETVGIAEYVAKLMDALTRQNQLRVAALKTADKVVTDDDGPLSSEEIAEEIGLPFKGNLEDGSN